MSSPSVKANTSLDSTLAYEDILLTCFAASGSPEGGTNMEIYTLLSAYESYFAAFALGKNYDATDTTYW